MLKLCLWHIKVIRKGKRREKNKLKFFSPFPEKSPNKKVCEKKKRRERVKRKEKKKNNNDEGSHGHWRSVSRARPECDNNKMASSLTADTFFNLSTQHQNNYNKELIYVKLTDSALRAIEDYARNQVGIRVLNASLQNCPAEKLKIRKRRLKIPREDSKVKFSLLLLLASSVFFLIRVM